MKLLYSWIYLYHSLTDLHYLLRHIYANEFSASRRRCWSGRESEVSLVTLYTKQSSAHKRCFIRHYMQDEMKITFSFLMFAYKTTTGTAPIYLNSLVQTYAPSRSLRSASERRLVVPSQRGTKSLSRTFTWTVPSWWNDLPISIRTAESLAIFKKHLKTHLFRQHLTN